MLPLSGPRCPSWRNHWRLSLKLCYAIRSSSSEKDGSKLGRCWGWGICPPIGIINTLHDVCMYLCGHAVLHLWCGPPSHHYFWTAKIGSSILIRILIPLAKMLYLMRWTDVLDRFTKYSKLRELFLLISSNWPTDTERYRIHVPYY